MGLRGHSLKPLGTNIFDKTYIYVKRSAALVKCSWGEKVYLLSGTSPLGVFKKGKNAYGKNIRSSKQSA